MEPNELEMTEKEAGVIYFKVLSWNFFRGTDWRV